MHEAVERALAAAKEHPGRATAKRQIVLAAILLFLAALLAPGAPLAAASLLSVAALFAWAARSILRDVTHFAFISPAYAAVTRGDHELAHALIDEAARRSPTGQARRAHGLVRAMLALDSADSPAVVKHTTEAVAVPPGLVGRDMHKAQLGVAHSMRALALATLREDEAALADAGAACRDGFASAESVAQSELARALVAANRQNKGEVRAILTRAAPFFDTLGGRQRELAKRLSLFASAPKRSIYRHAARPDEATVDAWLSEPAKTKMEVPPAAAATAVAPPVVTKPPSRSIRPLLVLWMVVLPIVFLLVLLVSSQVPPPVRPSPPVGGTSPVSTIAFCSAAFLYLLVARNLIGAARKRAARLRASIGALRGDPTAIGVLEKQSRAGAPAASLALAAIAEREGRFEEAIAHCDAGIGYVNASEAARLIAHDITAPGLYAERAFCYAALGKPDEADAILAAMPNASSYALAPAARLRVELAKALVRGDRAGALAVARSRSDALPMSMREAFLIDLLEATEGRGADDEEWSRLLAELAADPKLARWVDHFMPSSSVRRRVAEPMLPEEDDEVVESLEHART